MKENEAIQELESRISPYDTCKADFDANEAIKTAIKALEEVQQYRAIGTPEECRAEQGFLGFSFRQNEPE